MTMQNEPMCALNPQARAHPPVLLYPPVLFYPIAVSHRSLSVETWDGGRRRCSLDSATSGTEMCLLIPLAEVGLLMDVLAISLHHRSRILQRPLHRVVDSKIPEDGLMTIFNKPFFASVANLALRHSADPAWTMYMDAMTQAALAPKLAAAIRAAGLATEIWAYDHNTDHPEYPQTVLDRSNGTVNSVAWCVDSGAPRSSMHYSSRLWPTR